MNLFILGCGYTGCRVAALAVARGWPVSALVRGKAAAKTVAEMGINPVPGDLDDPASLRTLSLAGCHLLYLAPPPDAGRSDPRTTRLCAALSENRRPEKIVYLSTTGVYGDCRGELIDETRPPRPASDRARRRIAAERTLLDWGRASRVPVVILRVAAIYGPGRLPLAAIGAGMPQLRREEAPFSSRIHVDDLAAACIAALERGEDQEIYNVCDDAPSTMTDYFLAVAETFDLAPPPLVSRAEAASRLSPAMLSYLAESRRVDNHKLLTRLGVTLAYPQLADGLAACRKSLRAMPRTPPRPSERP